MPGEGGIALGRGETLPAFRPAPTAERNYAMAELAMKQKRYILAQRFYYFIRRKFPYSRFAILADLRIADCQYERERWIEAIDGYQNFVRLHPTHPQVPFAMFRTGMANYRLVPNDWFFLPPAHEKDQKNVKETANALSNYLRRFPDDANAEEAGKLLANVRKRLLAHERYAADFYKRLGRYRGYVGRLETIKKKYGDVGKDSKLLLEIVEAYVELGDEPKARATVVELEKDFPDTDELEKARASLASLPPPAPAEDEAAPAAEASTADEPGKPPTAEDLR